MLFGYMEGETNERLIRAVSMLFSMVGFFGVIGPTRDPGIYRKPDENSRDGQYKFATNYKYRQNKYQNPPLLPDQRHGMNDRAENLRRQQYPCQYRYQKIKVIGCVFGCSNTMA